MTEYQQVINKAEIALNNGEYNYCINLLNPLLEKFTTSTYEGVNIRMILITSLSGVNRPVSYTHLTLPTKQMV